MNNHNTVVKPDSKWLSDMLQAEIGDKDRKEFVEFFLSNTRTVLLKDPRSYLSYGPFWWPLKSLLVSKGYLDFGHVTQLEWVESLSYPEESLTIAACWAYANERFEEGNRYNYRHLLPTEDGEGMEYFLGDDELEIIMNSKALTRA